jgi:hypothetical protein
VIGNGNAGTRSNAHTIDWDGNAWFAGTIEAKKDIKSESLETKTAKIANGLQINGSTTTSNLEVNNKITTVNLNATGNITKNGANVALASELIGKRYPGDQGGGETFNDYGSN